MRRRLRLLAAATTSMVVLAFVLPLAWVLRDVAWQRALARATQEAESVASVLPVVDGDEARTQVVDAVRARTDDRITLFLPDGRSVGDPQPVDRAVEQARAGKAFAALTPVGGRDVLIPVVTGNDETAVVSVAVSADRLRRGVGEAWLLLVVVGVGLVVVAVVVAGRLARSMVRPMEGLAATALLLEQGDLEARAALEGPPESVEVGRALNLLAQRIVDLVAAEREALADLSHRLRTPLTALRLDVENVSDPEEAERLGRSVDELADAVSRLIGELRRPTAVPDDGADAAAIVNDRAAFWSALAEEQGRPFVVDVPDGAVIVGASRTALCDAMDAVLGNVFAHTPEGSAFRVSVVGEEAVAVIVVDDDGPGLPAADVVGRGVSGAGSTGLGLDIARRAAEEAHGSLRLGASPTGGARVVLTLPLASTPGSSIAGAAPRRVHGDGGSPPVVRLSSAG